MESNKTFSDLQCKLSSGNEEKKIITGSMCCEMMLKPKDMN